MKDKSKNIFDIAKQLLPKFNIEFVADVVKSLVPSNTIVPPLFVLKVGPLVSVCVNVVGCRLNQEVPLPGYDAVLPAS
jgi:hypothetical protein